MRTTLSLVILLFGTAPAWSAPTLDGREASIYATADNPFEIEFDSDGTLYAAHNSPSNGPAKIYRIAAGGGAAAEWGTATPEDPDGIDVFGGFVYASSEDTIWRTDITTGVSSAWATLSVPRNQSTLVIDEAGTYLGAGTVIVGNARFGNDIEIIGPGVNQVSTFVASAELDVVRALQFAGGGLYFAETSANQGVWSVDSQGVLTKVADGGYNWALPDAMVHEPGTDTFLVGDGNQLLRLPRAGGTVQVVGTGFGTISGLTFDANGHLYVADRGEGKIWRVSLPLSVDVPASTVAGRTVTAMLFLAAGAALIHRRRSLPI